MKRFKEWWKDKWQYTSFRYGVIVVALLILCVVVSIYADIRDRREQPFPVSNGPDAFSSHVRSYLVQIAGSQIQQPHSTE